MRLISSRLFSVPLARISAATPLSRRFLSLVWVALAASALVPQVKPFQVCEGPLNQVCGNATRDLFEAAGDKIWSQAGIDIVFLNWEILPAADTDLSFAEAESLRLSWQPVAPIIGLFFFQSLSGCGPTYGCAYKDMGLSFISDLTFNLGAPRIDAIYHEIGHNLGLAHTPGSPFLNLMTDGGLRFAPSSINDITPDGANMDQLTPDQIATALRSPLVVADAQVPEPASWVLGAAVAFLPLLRRRSRAA